MFERVTLSRFLGGTELPKPSLVFTRVLPPLCRGRCFRGSDPLCDYSIALVVRFVKYFFIFFSVVRGLGEEDFLNLFSSHVVLFHQYFYHFLTSYLSPLCDYSIAHAPGIVNPFLGFF